MTSCSSSTKHIKELLSSRTGSFLLRLCRYLAGIATAGFLLLDAILAGHKMAEAGSRPGQVAGYYLLLLTLQLICLFFILSIGFRLIFRYISELEKEWHTETEGLKTKNLLLEKELKKMLEAKELMLPAALKKELPGKLFTQKEFPARLDAFRTVMDFVRDGLEAEGCRPETIRDLSTAIEELFVNVATYAYPEGEGSILIRYQLQGNRVMITLEDNGIPFDPLSILPAPADSLQEHECRESTGGLGLFMVRELVDDIQYEYINNKNTITICITEEAATFADVG